MIDERQRWGSHVYLRCSSCGCLFYTKNIGIIGARSIFPFIRNCDCPLEDLLPVLEDDYADLEERERKRIETEFLTQHNYNLVRIHNNLRHLYKSKKKAFQELRLFQGKVKAIKSNFFLSRYSQKEIEKAHRERKRKEYRGTIVLLNQLKVRDFSKEEVIDILKNWKERRKETC